MLCSQTQRMAPPSICWPKPASFCPLTSHSNQMLPHALQKYLLNAYYVPLIPANSFSTLWHPKWSFQEIQNLILSHLVPSIAPINRKQNL